MSEFRVTWIVQLDATDPVDAAKQAWAMLDDATDRNAGATVLVVESVDDPQVAKTIDMELVL